MSTKSFVNLSSNEALVCAAALRAVTALPQSGWTPERLQTAQRLATQIEQAAAHE